MEMNQIVYVVSNVKTGEIFGAYNEMEDAVRATQMEDFEGEDVAITPILVDAHPVIDNLNCYTVEEVEDATEALVEWARDDGPYDWSEDEDEEEDDGEVTADDILREIAALILSYLDDEEEE